MRYFTFGLMLLSLFLLALNSIGHFIPPLTSDYPPEENARHYTQRELSPAAAREQLSIAHASTTMRNREKLERFFFLLTHSFVHGSSYTLKPYDNWYLWTQAFLSNSDFEKNVILDTQNAELLWRRGRGFCHQVAWIFVKFARDMGFASGLVRLNNHYVAEVEYDKDKWLTVDPDLGLLWNGRFSSAEFQEQLKSIHQKLTHTGYSEKRAKRLAELYAIRPESVVYKNFYISRDYYIQEINAFRYMWWIPIGALIVSLFMYLVGKRLTQPLKS